MILTVYLITQLLHFCGFISLILYYDFSNENHWKFVIFRDWSIILQLYSTCHLNFARLPSSALPAACHFLPFFYRSCSSARSMIFLNKPSIFSNILVIVIFISVSNSSSNTLDSMLPPIKLVICCFHRKFFVKTWKLIFPVTILKHFS